MKTISAGVRWFCADQRRWWVTLGMAGWLLFMGARYAHFATLAVTGFERCQQEPASCEGDDLTMSLWTVMEVNASGYVVRKVGGPVPVMGPTEGLAVGDRVSVVGRYDATQQVVVEQTRLLHRWRRLKEIWSVVGLLGVVVMVPLTFKLRKGGVVERG